MYSTYFLLFFEFFKVGLFTFGGGYASLPFLYQICENYNWFTHNDLVQLIAVSGLTPGPIGLNMATFSGFKTLGFFGSIISSFALILPMIIITTQVFRLYKKFCENKYVKSILYFLRPTSCALITLVGIKLLFSLVFSNDLNFNSIDYKAIFLLFVLFMLTFKSLRNPVYYMLLASIISIIFYFWHVMIS